MQVLYIVFVWIYVLIKSQVPIFSACIHKFKWFRHNFKSNLFRHTSFQKSLFRHTYI